LFSLYITNSSSIFIRPHLSLHSGRRRRFIHFKSKQTHLTQYHNILFSSQVFLQMEKILGFVSFLYIEAYGCLSMFLRARLHAQGIWSQGMIVQRLLILWYHGNLVSHNFHLFIWLTRRREIHWRLCKVSRILSKILGFST